MKQLKSNKYKALMTDIDGTLIPNSKDHLNVNKNVKDKIKKASKIINVGVATSRPLEFASRFLDDLDLTSPCIISGGAQIHDPVKKRIIYEKNIEKAAIKEIFKIIDNHGLTLLDDGRGTMGNIKEKDVTHYTQFWIKIYNQNDLSIVISELSNIPEISVHKIISRFEEDDFEIIINHTQATKQHGIQKVAELLGIKTKDIIGIGDGYNDFPLLMACGLKVAMGNAVDELKAIADYIAPPVEKDGVADVIERFVLNGQAN